MSRNSLFFAAPLALVFLAGVEPRFEGRLVSAEEKAQLRLEREKKAAASLGLVYESGRWAIPQGRPAAETSHAAPWSLEAISQSANLSFEVYDTLHCRVAGNVDRQRLRDLGQAAEKAWIAFQKLQFGESGGGLGVIDASFAAEDGGRFLLFWVRDAASRERLRAAQTNRADLVLVLEEGRSRAQAIAAGMHRFAHVLTQRLRFDGKNLPYWFEEALACRLDLKLGEPEPQSCAPRFAKGDASSELGKESWLSQVQALHTQKRLRPLKVLVGLGSAEMTREDVLQSIAFLDFLAKRTTVFKLQDAFRAQVPAAGSPFPLGADAVRPHENVWRAVLGSGDWNALESAWKSALEAAR